MNDREPARAHWRDDGLAAAIVGLDGGWLAGLSVRDWYGSGQTVSEIAWVVSFLPAGAEMTAEVLVEAPALAADTEARREYLLAAARAAIAAGEPPAPEATETPSASPSSPDEWSEHLDLQILCWEDALHGLGQALEAGSNDQDHFLRYKAVSEALERVYAADQSLGILWRRVLSEPTRRRLSAEADEHALRAIENNLSVSEKVGRTYDPKTDPVFTAYYERMRSRRPYQHWGDLLLAGQFQHGYFLGLQWARGQMMHAATSAPVERRQWRVGVAPRWKWSKSDGWFRGRPDAAERRAYDVHVAGGAADVMGQLSNLTELFLDAKGALVKALRADRGEQPDH